jgi:hypothetical protein
MKGLDLDEYQASDDSRDERHHGGCYRNSERQHPISSARPPQLGGKKRSRSKSRRQILVAEPSSMNLPERESQPHTVSLALEPPDFDQLTRIED